MPGLSRDKVKQTYFLLALTLLGSMLGYMVREYISSFLGAATIYILLRRPLFYLIDRRRWPRAPAALLMMLLSMVVMVLPLVLISMMLSSKAGYMVSHYTGFMQMVRDWSSAFSSRFGIDLLSGDSLGKVAQAGANIIPEVLSATVSSVAQLAVMYFLVYFMMIDGHLIEPWVMDNAPFRNENTLLLVRELKTQTMSNALGIPLLIVVQAFCAGIGYWIFGMDEPFFWAVITGFASMLPLVGPAVIWVPLTIFMYFDGHHGGAIGLAIYSALVLVNVEHIVRFTLLKKLGHTHPLITFFGIIIGLSLFGFLGLIFGPLLISYFLILLNIYHKEYLPGDETIYDEVLKKEGE